MKKDYDRFEISQMISEIVDWIVDHMDQKEIIELAYNHVFDNVAEQSNAEIIAQYKSMFEED